MTSVFAQHAKREVALSFAIAGQKPFITNGDERSGFWREPLILNLRYQVATDYIMSVSVFLEHINEERNRVDLWNDQPNTSVTPAYNAEINERLTMTLFGVEGARTLLRFDDFRLALTLGLGYGLGGASADARNIATDERKSFESSDVWQGLYLNSSLRGRYTVYQGEHYDVGVAASFRVWGFPAIGPFGDSRTSYNGPAIEGVYEVGYLVGVSLGFF